MDLNYNFFEFGYIPNIEEMLDDLFKTIKENSDDSKMELGDRVYPWDGSYCSDLCGNRCYIMNQPFISTPYWIVISNTETGKMKNHLQDLIIVHPITKEKF